MSNLSIPNYLFKYDINLLKTEIDHIFANDKYYQLRKRSIDQKMDLNKILELVECLEQGCSLRQCAKKLKINVSTLTRSLLKVAVQKWKDGQSYWKINLHTWVKHYASFRKSIHKWWSNWTCRKWKNVLDFIKTNAPLWSKIKKLSGQLILQKLRWEFNGKIPSLRTLYNWFNSKVLSTLKQDLIFKRGYRKKSKNVKEPKRPKAVFNDNWKDYRGYLKIAHLDNVYQLDTMSGKKSDRFWNLVLVNVQTTRFYSQRCLKNKWAIRDALKYLLAKHKLKIDHLLMDNGWENILLDQVDPNINLYYCDAGSPWQKGMVERTIRGLRTYHLLAKSCSIDLVSQNQLDWIVNDYWQFKQAING